MPNTVHFNIEVGETGPDWEPTAETKFYAQVDGDFEFGPTPAAAVRKLIDSLEQQDELAR